jgi:mono/diheme cytochrome c family protein
MKKMLRYLLWGTSAILLLAAGILLYVRFALPKVGDSPFLKVELTPERVARGEYLANHVAVCIDCHSQRDWSRFSGPPKEGTLGMGGDVFNQKFGFPGVYYAKNITPAGIGRYTDGELFRVITTGVSREGKALFPVMPYHNYGQMDEEDILSIIAYIRTLKPIKNEVPESVSDFPMNFIINTIPARAKLTKIPARSDTVAYGKYLVNAAACIDCHTPFSKGKYAEGMEYAGGREFPFPSGAVVRSVNLTPDPETGLGRWDEELFIETFRSHSDSLTLATLLGPADMNSIMPWTMYGKMKEEDLKAIFAYLRSVTPVKNKVIRFSPAGTAQASN